MLSISQLRTAIFVSRRSDLRELQPLGAALGALHDGLDEGHAVHAVLDGRVIEILGERLACQLGLDGAEGLEVDVGEGLEVTLGMAGGDAGEFFALVADVAVAAAPDLTGLVAVLDHELVGKFLTPFESGLGAVDADVEHVFVADADL